MEIEQGLDQCHEEMKKLNSSWGEESDCFHFLSAAAAEVVEVEIDVDS